MKNILKLQENGMLLQLVSLCYQTLIIHMIRTQMLPFIQGRASILVLLSSILAIIVGIMI
ncbi:MAG: hypothetical protein LLF98_05395 [Clostridium sp.]|uniref:hypothetical protein n=1 Tax=Clostridium sp. TaxID=1506 RepID=UPI0025BCC7B4|nr:hypothetical protein [Clostridium sp.]MCE5220704.1 hypothetical protein [Clostridium sp.]